MLLNPPKQIVFEFQRSNSKLIFNFLSKLTRNYSALRVIFVVYAIFPGDLLLVEQSF